MMANTQSALRFDIGVSHLFPGEKLPQGDPRWGQHTRSFVKETHTIDSLAKAIAIEGCSISAVMKDSHRTGANFMSAQHLALDCDQETFESSIDGLLGNDFISDYAATIHETPSSTPDKPRSRVVFVLDSPITDPQEYRLAAESLVWKFGTVDAVCKDEARLFFGRKNARHVVLGNILYKDILYEEVIEPYQRYKASTNGYRRSNPIPDTILKNRNNTLTSLGGTMRWAGMSEDEIDEIYAALQVVNANRTPDPLDDSEVRKVANSVSRYEPASFPHAWDSAGPEEEWPELKNLPQSQTPPPLPPEMVPEPYRPWALDIARQGCFPLEMVIAPALVGTSAVIGRKLGIRPWRFSDFTVVPNLWGVLVTPPSSLKSNAIDQAIRPVKRLAATAHDRFQATIAQEGARLCALEAEVEGLKSLMRQGARKGTPAGDLEAQIADKLQRLDDARKESVERRYWVADSTTEKLADLLKDNPSGLLVSYDEIAGWLADMEKPGREGSRAFYLAAWEGTGDHYVDRIGRGSSYIPAVCLSVIGGIQPDRLRRHIDEALSGGSGGDGLIQRFQLMIYVDSLGDWKAPDSWPQSAARDRAYQVFQALDEMDVKALGAQFDGSIPYLRFSPDAQAVADEWRDEWEQRLRGNSLKGLPVFAAHLGKYRSLMPSLALIFHLIKYVSSGGSSYGGSEVGLEDVVLACEWCAYLEQHAQRVYQAEVSPGLDAAHRLAEKIQAGRIQHGESVRGIYRHEWSGLTTNAQVMRGLEDLEMAGWVRVVSHQAPGGPGAPTQVVHLHPALRGKKIG